MKKFPRTNLFPSHIDRIKLIFYEHDIINELYKMKAHNKTGLEYCGKEKLDLSSYMYTYQS